MNYKPKKSKLEQVKDIVNSNTQSPEKKFDNDFSNFYIFGTVAILLIKVYLSKKWKIGK